MPGRLAEIPFAGLTAALVSGIAAAHIFQGCSFSLLAAGQASLVGAAICALAKRQVWRACFAVLMAIAVSGWLIAAGMKTGHSPDTLPYHLSHDLFPLDQLVLFEGCLVDEARRSAEGVLTTLELRAYRYGQRWIPGRGRAELRISGSPSAIEEAIPDLRVGDRVRGWATWRIPTRYGNPGSHDHAEFLQRQGIALVGRVKSPRVLEVLPADCSAPLDRAASSLRIHLLATLERMKDRGMLQEAALLASILLGDPSWIGQVTRDAFQNSGTYHVLVVSGLHVAWIAWVAMTALEALGIPKRWSYLLSASIIFAYALLVGFQASISRALWMYALYVVGQSICRRGQPANVAFATAFLLLALRPNWLHDAGFQLSFVSVLAITLMGLPIQEQVLRPMMQPLRHAGDGRKIPFTPGRIGCRGRRLRTEAELLAEAIGDRWGQRLENRLLGCVRFAARAAFAASSMFLVSFSVQIWVEPILAHHFNRISWIAPVANILAVPLSSAILAVGGVAVSVAGILPSADPLLTAAGALARLLLALTSWLSDFPGAWLRCPTPDGLLVTGVLLLLFVWHVLGWSSGWLPCATSVTLLFVLVLAAPPARIIRAIAAHAGPGSEAPASPRTAGTANAEVDDRQDGKDQARRINTTAGYRPGALQLIFLDVGQGDSIAIRFPDFRTWVLDAGGTRLNASEAVPSSRFDVGEAVVSRYLWHRWILWLDLVLLSHPHLDHAGGMQAVIRNFSPARMACSSNKEDAVIQRILAAAVERGVRPVLFSSLSNMRIAGVRVETVQIPEERLAGSDNENSLVVRLTYGRFSALLTGDIGRTSEMQIAARRGGSLRSTLLKAAHHGSRSSTSDIFLDQVRPSWAVISAGRNNPFGEPAREVVLRLARRGVLPLLTMDQGAIILETDGEWYTLSTFVSGVLESGVLPER